MAILDEQARRLMTSRPHKDALLCIGGEGVVQRARQSLVAERLESIHRQKLTILAELKQSILHKAFTGELTADARVGEHRFSEAGV